MASGHQSLNVIGLVMASRKRIRFAKIVTTNIEIFAIVFNNDYYDHQIIYYDPLCYIHPSLKKKKFVPEIRSTIMGGHNNNITLSPGP